MVSLPIQKLVHSGSSSGTVAAKTEIVYDESSYVTTSSGTMPSAASGSWVDQTGSGELGSTLGAIHGNATTVKSYYDITNGYHIDTHSFFDQYGNLRTARDGSGNDTTTVYADTYAFAYPTSVTTSVPDSTGTYGSSSALTTSMTYDYNTGLKSDVTDPNGAVTRMDYDDALLRPTKVTTGYGTSLAAQTTTEYGDTSGSLYVKVSSQIDSSNWKVGYKYLDNIGRTIRTREVDTAGDVYAMTCYDNMSRVSKATNPFRGYSSQTCSTTTGLDWTANTFDSHGRLWKVTTPDSAIVETTFDLATSGSQIGTTTTVTDQAGKLRRSVTNALGQLSRVDEPNSSNALGSISSPNQDTDYAYDTLNNLTTVTQGSQTRSFNYDALSRLKDATNPESGTIKYTYDYNGNLKTKWDARGIKTIYDYDTLNRVWKRCYKSVGTSSLGYTTCADAASHSETVETNTPDVTMNYDNVTNAKGKLVKVTSSLSTTEYTSFDTMGRVTGHKQTTDGGDSGGYTTSYTYNLSGALIDETYPSGRVVENALDANGELAQVQSHKSGDSFHDYADAFSYTAAGAVSSMRLGNNKWENTTFNSRLQPTQIGLGSSATDTGLLKLNYTYSTSGNHDNNGNVLSQTITVNRSNQNPLVFSQSYVYDELNRLHSAEEVTGTTSNWKQTFTFDRYGNRRFDQSNTTQPSSFSNTNLTNPTFDSTNNRMSSGQSWTYDAAGNVTVDPDGRTFTYDGENKQKEAKNSSSATLGTYYFDGDGKRVKKVVPSTGETTIFVYDAGSKLVAEYSTNLSSTPKIQYQTEDNLGTPRINTDQLGQIVSRTDYMPYGEEIIGLGGRSSTDKYVTDDVRQGFTGYINDEETGLDYAKARMYTNKLGRFTSVDSGAFTPADPQNWNRYPNVQNNPLKFIDPFGKDLVLTGKNADYIVSELAKATGLKLSRCTSVDPKAGCNKVGEVLVTGIVEKQSSKKSANLANKLAEIVGDSKHTVSIDAGQNQAKVFFDSFTKREIDVADYDAAKKNAPEFAIRSLAHVLEEYYQAETTFSSEGESSKYTKSHTMALAFESKVLGDFTGQVEQPRENPGYQNGDIHVKYRFTSVEYDVKRKTGIGKDKSLSNIEKVSKKSLP